MKPVFLESDSIEEWVQAALQDLRWVIDDTLSQHPTCRIVLSGGSTPKPLYEAMAASPLPWDRLEFIIMDERYVPSDDPESNLKMIRKALFSKAPLNPAQLYCFDTSLPWKEAAKEMERQLKGLQLKRRPLCDLLILGAGQDGHIASIFGAQDYDDSLARCSVAHGYPTESRLSLGITALSEATSALLLLVGESKKPLIEALQHPSQSTPVELIVQRVPTKLHYCPKAL